MNFYDILAAEKWGGGIPTINFFDLLFSQSISGEQWQVYEGTLPATINANGDNLRQYQVWGNAGGVGEEVDITGLSEPLCGIGSYTDSLDLSTGILTRKIKKLVLTGAENITNLGDYYNCGVTISSIAWRTASSTVGGGFTASNNGRSLWAIKSNFSAFTTVTDFKSYLQQQYAAGTPVTVWYVLAEPEVSTLTVPSGLTGTIEGYLIQDGTPTPETPIYPTANGVKQADNTYSIKYGYKLDMASKTRNSLPSAAEQTITLNGVTATCDGKGKYSFTGTASAPVTITFTLPYDYTIPMSKGGGGNGTFSMFNTKSWSGSTSNNLGLLYNTTLIDTWNFTTVNRNAISYVAMAGKTINALRFNFLANTNTNFSCSPMFTDDSYGLPNVYEPYFNITTPIYIGDDPLDKDEYIDYQAGKICRMSGGVLTPTDPPVPLPALPTCEGETVIDYAGESVAPEKVYFEYQGGKQP